MLANLILTLPHARLPDLPGRFAAVPEFFQSIFLFQRVHAGPEAIVLIAHQFPVLGELFDRIAFPDSVVTIDVVEDTAVEEEITAIDPALASLRLFVEGGNAVSVECDATKTRWRAYGRDRRQLAVGLMERHQSREIEVGDAIAIGEHERLVVLEPLLYALQTPTCLGVQ